MLGLVACDNQGQLEPGTGYLDLRVSRDLTLDVVPVVKSGEAENVVISVTITPKEGGESLHIADINQVQEPIKLKTGDYIAVATSGEDKGAAAFDSPFYYGQTEFTVVNMQMVTKEIVCTLASVKVTADFSSTFTTAFDYKLTVSNGEASLEFSEAEGTIGKDAYFHVSDQLSWILEVKNANGEIFSLEETYTDIQPRQHYALNFDVERDDEAFGAAEFIIIVDDSMTVKEYDMPIYIYPDMPITTGAENITLYSGDSLESALYEIVSTKAYASVVLSHESEAFAALGLPSSSEFVGASADMIQALADLGVDVSYTINGVPTDAITAETTEVKFDFAGLINRLPLGNHSFTISATNELDVASSYVVNISVLNPVEITSVNPWAKFAVVKGVYHTAAAPAGLTVEYMTGSSSWTSENILLQEVDAANKTFKVMICKLAENTTYSFRAITSKDGVIEGTLSGKTQSIVTIPNMNFDQWGTSSVQYPYTGKNNGIWDTANEGLSSVGTLNITTQETTDVVKGSAVRMQSDYVTIVIISKFAAGNIYTGDFVNVTTSPQGAQLNWGIRFNGRPVALKGYYKYTPANIDYTDNAHSHLKGQKDKCQIQVALADGTTSSTNNSDYYYFVDTGNNKFVDFSSENKTLIAHNKLESDETVTSYKAFTLPMGYRDVTKIPTYAIVTCCSSYLGDYFTGGKGSLMLADEFEFVYDPSDEAMSDEQRREFFNLF